MRRAALRLSSLLLSLFLALAACSAPPQPVQDDLIDGELYTRVGLKGQPGSPTTALYSTSYLMSPSYFPPGTQCEIQQYTDQYILMSLDGQACRMEPATGRFPTDNAGLKTFVSKMFLRNEPDLSGISEGRRKATLSGRPAIGSTKEEVLFSVGYPAAVGGNTPALDMTREQILNENRWIYWNVWGLFGASVQYYDFDGEGQLIEIVR